MLPSRSRRFSTLTGRLSLRAKGILVVAIPVAALLVLMTAFYQLEKQSQQAQALVEHTFQVRSEIRQLMMDTGTSEAGVRGYLLSRNPSFLASYDAAVQQIPARVTAIGKLTADNPEQQAAIARVTELANRSMEALNALRGHTEGAPSLDESRAITQQLRRELAQMQRREDVLLQQRTEDVRQAQAHLESGTLAGGGLGLLGGILAALFFSSGVVRRVHALEADAHKVALGVPVTGEIDGSDEIARLSTTLQQTSRLLTRQREDLQEAQRDLEVRVQQRTAELSQANEELRRSNEVKEILVSSTPLAIWTLDLDGKVSFWNPAAEAIFGYAANEVLGKPLPVVPPEGCEEYAEWLERFRRGESLNGVERKRVRKDGTRIDVTIWTAPLRDSAGRIAGTIAIDNDITQTKSLEEQFRQSQKLEAVGRLAGGVAHDFNNLLTVIMGYVEMLSAEVQGQPALLDYSQEIQYAATRASALTAQLLAFSRRQVSQPKVIDLNEVVTHSTKLLRRIIGEDIEISTHLAANLGKVKADPIHIDQVIMNLVVNARDAMGTGGKLTIETANMVLDADYAGRHIGVNPGHYVLLAISDTGSGMPPEVRNRIFEPFFTTKEAGKGTGLGLSIVYGVVKQNHGEVMVYSEPGRGTTFKIYLPAVEVAAETEAASLSTSDLRGSETILLCEDEPGIRKLVHAMLAKHGYRVLEAPSPEEALDLARQNGPIHLLLTDVIMPRMNGFDLARTLRAERPDTRVLYMSGYTDNRVGATWELGPDTPFVQKPFTATVLAQKVREALADSPRPA
ncbi:MAG TPA: CHASE3 domain-containing protein [Candidatus Limnocylindrales bacterium]|nr:CHASE3 domain-containing protein [Candidatus Limnocylindrales bacterium]